MLTRQDRQIDGLIPQVLDDRMPTGTKTRKRNVRYPFTDATAYASVRIDRGRQRLVEQEVEEGEAAIGQKRIPPADDQVHHLLAVPRPIP